MATSGPHPKFSPGDLVKFKNSGEYIVLSLTNEIGFNKYQLLNIDNGQQEIAHSFEIEKIGSADILTTEDEELIEIPQEPKNKRFKSMKQEELDNLAKKRSEPATDKQTLWAVNILKGKISYFRHRPKM
jgi:hypothetical protein